MISDYLQELWTILLQLSPALLLGLLLAGVLRVFFPERLVRAHLSQATLGSAIRAALIGVPMPLCSCGVVPAAIGLRNQGASRGATTSFLISTPQTGVDSVLVSAVFLGWPFALFKVVAAFATGVLGGGLVNRFAPHDPSPSGTVEQGDAWRSGKNRFTALLKYAMFDILAVIDLWLIVGILLAAAVATAIPDDYFRGVAWTQGIGGMLLVLAISLPLYVCTTSSVPIAASLIAAGMPAGTALVFLMAGPATNVATIGVVYRALGGRILALYLGVVIVASIGFGMGFDFVVSEAGVDLAHHDHLAGRWWETASAVLLVGLLAFLVGRRMQRRWSGTHETGEKRDMDLVLKIEGMTCQHCVANVKGALESVEGVEEVTVDLDGGLARLKGDHLAQNELAAAIHKAGYKVIE